jgi:hypothetical protein
MTDTLITDVTLTDEILLSKSQDLLVQTQADLNAMLDPLDMSGSLTLRERDRYEHKRAVLRARLQTLTQYLPTLPTLAPQIAEYTSWRDMLARIRQTLCDELLALEARNPKQYNLRWSIMTIDRGAEPGTGYEIENSRLGELLRAEGLTAPPPTDGRLHGRLPWRGSLTEIEHRLHELQQRYDDARGRLRSLVQEGATTD